MWTLVANIFGDIQPHEHAYWQPSSSLIITKTWPHPAVFRLQCWDALGQTTRQGHSPTHQQTGYLKSFQAHSHISSHPETKSHPTEGQDSAPPTSGQVLVTAIRKPATSPCINFTHKEADNRSMRSYNTAAYRMETMQKAI